MKNVMHVIVILFVVPATFFFTFWVPFSMLRIFFAVPIWIIVAISFVSAAGVGWYTWKLLGDPSSNIVSSTLIGGILTGCVAFCLGFFGPMIFFPGANQGPMIGLLITGPLGFIVGCIGGFVYWKVKGKNKSQKNSSTVQGE